MFQLENIYILEFAVLTKLITKVPFEPLEIRVEKWKKHDGLKVLGSKRRGYERYLCTFAFSFRIRFRYLNIQFGAYFSMSG